MFRTTTPSYALAIVLLLAGVGCDDKKAETPAATQAIEGAPKSEGAEGDKKKGKKDKDKPEGAHAKRERTPEEIAARGTKLELEACQANIRFPKTLFVASDAAAKGTLRRIELAQDTPENRAKLTPETPAAQRPGVIGISIYARTAKGKVGEWIKTPFAAGAKLDSRITAVSGKKAHYVQASGAGGRKDAMIFGCKDKFLVVDVPFTAPDAELRKTFASVVSTFKFANKTAQETNGGCRAPSPGCAAPMLAACVDRTWSCAEVKAKAPAAAGADKSDDE